MPAAYFKLLAALMKDNPPAKADAPMVAKLAKIGIVPGQDFDISKLDPAVAKGLQSVPKAALEKIMANFKTIGHAGQRLGILTEDWALRHRLPATAPSLPPSAWAPTGRRMPSIRPPRRTRTASPMTAPTSTSCTSTRARLPPVKGFWSLTMYNAEYFFVANPLNRYTLSPRNKFKYNQDGSVDLYIQNESPGKDKEANWLPAPKGKFILMLRLYWPKEPAPAFDPRRHLEAAGSEDR